MGSGNWRRSLNRVDPAVKQERAERQGEFVDRHK